MLSIFTPQLKPRTTTTPESAAGDAADMDLLSHQARTPLHAINARLERLQKLPAKLHRAGSISRADNLSSPMSAEDCELQKKIAEILDELKHNLNLAQQDIDELSLYTEAGKHIALSQWQPHPQSENGSPDQFQAELQRFQRHFATLQSTQQMLQLFLDKLMKPSHTDLPHALKQIANQSAAALKTTRAAAEKLVASVPGPKAEAVAADKQAYPAAATINALIVDDNMVNQHILIRFLKKRHHSFTVAKNGAEAVEKFSQQAFDIVFMDLQMPVMDGYAATREIRKIEKRRGSKQTPVVALTANAPTAENKSLCQAAGMNDFVSKPFGATDIYRLIKRHTSKEVVSPTSSDIDDEAPTLPIALPLPSRSGRLLGKAVAVISTTAASLSSTTAASLSSTAGFISRCRSRTSIQQRSAAPDFEEAIDPPLAVNSIKPCASSLLAVFGFLSSGAPVSVTINEPINELTIEVQVHF